MMEFDKGPDLRNPGFSDVMPMDLQVLHHCLEMIEDRDKWALEFGTGNGTTARLIGEYVPVITFDSFLGLPEDWRPEFPKGSFGDLEPPAPIPGATVVIGWFEETLENYEFPEEVSLIHFDADLYSSTMTALEAVVSAGLLQHGVILVFDEFFGYEGCENHEQRAFDEYFASHDYEVIGHGREQWAVRIK